MTGTKSLDRTGRKLKPAVIACQRCGVPVEQSVRGAPKFYCSKSCKDNLRGPVSRWCVICGKVVVAVNRGKPRRFCSIACGYLGRKDHVRSCQGCKAAFRSKNPKQQFCSPKCSNSNKPPGHRRDANCLVCNKEFQARPYQRCCSQRCSWKNDTKTRRMYKNALIRLRREHIAAGEKFSPFEIFSRDGWDCQLCGLWVDRTAGVPSLLAPTLDHIVPLSKGGEHTRANVQLAHFHCNCVKGAS